MQLTLWRLHYFRRRLEIDILGFFGHELFLHFHDIVHRVRAFWSLNHFEIVVFSLAGCDEQMLMDCLLRVADGEVIFWG